MSDTPAGYIISWKVPTIVDLKALRTGLEQAGLDPEELAPDLKPAALVARTAGFIAKLTSDDDRKRLSRPVAHGVRQITAEEHVDDDLTYTKEASLKLAADGITLECDDPKFAEMVPSSSSTVATTRTASDVTRIVQRVVESVGSDLIPVREQGGAYFIPNGNKVIEQIASLLTGIGGSLSTFACTIGHGSEESIANVITDYLLKQIAELKDSIEQLNEEGIRADVKSRRLTRVAELRERVAAYASLLGTQSTMLNATIAAAEASLLAKLGPAKEPTSEAA